MIPDIEDIDMNERWTFEGDHLVARNLSGAVLCAWLADEAQGGPLAQLLNQAPGLSRLLLPPWIGAQGARAMVEASS